MNKPPVGHPPVEFPDEPPYTNLVFHFDTNPDVDFFLYTDTNYYGFCPSTYSYLDTSLDNRRLGNIYKNLGTDPDNGLGITAPFKLEPSATRSARDIDFGIDENPNTALYDDLGINNALNFTINHCVDTGLGN